MQVLEKEPLDSESINLEFCEIEELSTLIPVLAKFHNLTELNLFGNRLDYLPESFGQLSRLKHLDISNNLFSGIEKVSAGLKSLKNLESLHITFTNNIDLDSLISILPQIKKVNDHEVSCNEDYSIKQTDLEKVALGYDEIRAVWRLLDESADKALAGHFDNSIKSIMGELSDVAKSRCPSILLNAYMIKAKHALNSMCMTKLVEYSKVKAPEIQHLFDNFYSELNNLHQILLKMLISALENNLKLSQEMQMLSQRVSPEYQEDLQHLKMKFKEKSEMLELAAKEKDELLEEIVSLQEENKKYLDTIIKRTKSTAEQAGQRTGQFAVLQKQELKDLIGFIYNSKSRLETSQPEGALRQTLAQHMFHSLAEKFKSRAKSIQKAGEIVASLKKYLEDVDILLFTKILKSECDENYRFLHDQVRETISEMVKEHTKTEEIKLKSWIEIVKFVYDSKDAEEMMKFIPMSKRTKATMSCSEFINYILQFQLKSHEKYISRFNALFKVADKDCDGLINDEEFTKLCESFELDIKRQDMSRFLEILDPDGSQRITYSDCVAVFSTELVPGKTNPILQELT